MFTGLAEFATFAAAPCRQVTSCPRVAYGEATLTVEIEILMFSAEVSVSCRREFAGGESDPRFIDLMPTPQIWTDYCDAFADEAA